MQIALHGAQNELLVVGLPVGGEQRAQQRQSLFHGGGGHQHLGDEDVVVVEERAHLKHGLGHGVDDLLSTVAPGESQLYRTADPLDLAANNVAFYLF